MTTLPTFQAQNPAISHYPLGWASCTCFAGAMAASYDRQVPKLMTGGAVRQMTGDTIGGTNLSQVDAALVKGWSVDLEVRYRLDWATFAKRINAGQAAVLQGWYQPIANSRFDAGGGFTGNHAIAVMPGWIGMDPLADGRRAGIYKYHGEAYPQTLLRAFAGQLNIGSGRIVRLGDGFVYAAFTRDNTRTYHLAFLGGAFWIYNLNSAGAIVSRYAESMSGPSGAPCEAPRLHPWPGNTSRSLVKVTAGKFAGKYIAPNGSTVRLEEVP